VRHSSKRIIKKLNVAVENVETKINFRRNKEKEEKKYIKIEH